MSPYIRPSMTEVDPVPDESSTELDNGGQDGGKLQLEARGMIIGCLAAKAREKKLAGAETVRQAAASGKPVDKRAALNLEQVRPYARRCLSRKEPQIIGDPRHDLDSSCQLKLRMWTRITR